MASCSAPGVSVTFDASSTSPGAEKLKSALTSGGAKVVGVALGLGARIPNLAANVKIALQELKGVSLLPHVRVVAPDGKVVLEQSGPADGLFDAVTERLGK